MAGLSIVDVSKRYGDVQALAPTSLEIPSGQFVGILGPSGCGKTTLLRCLAGLETPETGVIVLGGATILDTGRGLVVPPHRRGIGMVFQDLALWPHLSVFENVAYSLRARRDTDRLRERVLDALELVQLPDHADRRPHQLSGGQQQRVAFARAVVGRPRVLFMDEPLSALDAALRIDLRAELTAITRELGLTTVYVTHDQHEAMSMADRLLILRDGAIRQDGPPETVYQRPRDRFVAEFIGRLNVLDTAAEADALVRERVHAANGSAGSSPLAGVRPEKVRLRRNGGPEVSLPAEVELSSYLGGRYELRCRLPQVEHPWVVYSDDHVAVGARIDLHVAADDLIVTSA